MIICIAIMLISAFFLCFQSDINDVQRKSIVVGQLAEDGARAACLEIDEDMPRMIRFYRDVLGFEIKEAEDTSNVYLVKNGTLFLMYGRKDFEKMTGRRYEYIKDLNGHFEIALYVDTFEEVDIAYNNAIRNGATSVLEPELEPWGQRTCYISDPEGNLIEIGSWNKQYEEKDK